MKSYTDFEQSRKLAEILPLESADIFFWKRTIKKDDYSIGVGHSKELQEGFTSKEIEYIPCWSLSSLLNVISGEIIENYFSPYLQKENGKYSIAYGNEELLCVADDPIDACCEMIIKLHEQKLL